MFVVVVLVVGLYFFDEQLETTAVAFEQHYYDAWVDQMYVDRTEKRRSLRLERVKTQTVVDTI